MELPSPFQKTKQKQETLSKFLVPIKKKLLKLTPPLLFTSDDFGLKSLNPGLRIRIRCFCMDPDPVFKFFWIQIRFVLRGLIRIRSISDWIHNPAFDHMSVCWSVGLSSFPKGGAGSYTSNYPPISLF